MKLYRIKGKEPWRLYLRDILSNGVLYSQYIPEMDGPLPDDHTIEEIDLNEENPIQEKPEAPKENSL